MTRSVAAFVLCLWTCPTVHAQTVSAPSTAAPSTAAPSTAAPASAATPSGTPTSGAQGGGVIVMEESSMADEQAKAHFRVGQSLYDSGRFSDAGAEWQKAYDLSKRAELLYNVYIAYRDASDLPHAIEALDLYLATAQVDPDLRVNLEARVRAMRESEAKRAADEQAAAQTTAAPSEPPVEPAPLTSEPVPPRVSPEEASRVAPYLLVAFGGSMLVGSLLTGLMASSATGDIEDACPMDRCPAGFDLENERSNAETLALVTDVLWIGGAIAASTGVVWLLVAGSSEQAPPATAACSHDGCYAAVAGTF